MSEDDIQAIVEGGRGPEHRRRFRQELDRALLNVTDLTVRSCTELLQGIDCRLSTPVALTWKRILDTSRDQTDPSENFVAWVALPEIETIRPRDLVWFEEAAMRIRAQRRVRVAEAITSLFDGNAPLSDRAKIEEFARVVTIPLLERAWLPRLVYDDHPSKNLRVLRRPEATELHERAANNGAAHAPNAWYGTYLDALRQTADPIAVGTASYLQCALAATHLDAMHHAIEQPAIVLSARHSWPLAHRVELVVVPADTLGSEVTDYLDPESLRNARDAVRSVCGDFPNSMAVFPGDYPGGFYSAAPVDIDGRSAGVALTAALLARSHGLNVIRSSLATAAIDTSRNVEPLKGDAELRCKGRLFGLLLQLEGALNGRYTKLYSAEENLKALQDGAKEAGTSFDRAIETILPLDDVTGTLTEDIYEGLIKRYTDPAFLKLSS